MDKRQSFLGGVTLGSTFALVFVGPIAQNLDYHIFADSRNFFGVPNAMDVLSCCAYLVVGAFGFAPTLHRLPRDPSGVAFLVAIVGVILTALGGAFYHLNPNNTSLMWYRLPSTIAVVGLFSAVFIDRVSVRGGRILLLPLLAFTMVGVGYWALSESLGRGDLRIYGFVRVLAFVLTPIVVAIYPERRKSETVPILGWFVCYTLSTVFEFQDREIFTFGELVSGHTLKHIAGAAGFIFIIRILKQREDQQT